MKSAIIALFLGASSSIKINGPPYFNEPAWNSNMTSATGFAQGPPGFNEPAWN